MSGAVVNPIRARGIRKSFGTLEVLKGVDLDLAKGEVLCILGPSGSGKSTLLRCINHLERPDGGMIEGVTYALDAAITPYRLDGNDKILLIGKGSAEGFAIATSNSAHLELGLSLRDAAGTPLHSKGYVEGHTAGLDHVTAGSSIALSVASLGQRELTDFSFKLSVDTDPTDGVAWKHYLLQGDADHGYAWALDADDDGVAGSPKDPTHATLAVDVGQGHFMLLDMLDLPAHEGLFDIRLDAYHGGVLVAETAVRMDIVGIAAQDIH